MPKNPPRRGEGTEGSWNLQEIRELIDVLIERQITEFEMERAGTRIRVRRGDAGVGSGAHSVHAGGVVPAAPLFSVSPPLTPATPAGPVSAPVEPASAESTEDLYIIKSPIVGTFYAAPAPNAPPFVASGDMVQVGQVLCIIEAMKLMNEIESEVAGEVVRTYVENGQPVEYGQSLFAIRPSHKK